MRVYRHPHHIPPEARGAVVAIGNFDGIHRGHQEVIRRAGRIAHEFEAPLGVVTFEPHPRAVFQPDQPPFRLTPFRVKARLIGLLGVERLYALHFTRRFAALTAEEFVGDVLGEALGVRHVVVGHDFRFGAKRRGTVEFMAEAGRAAGFGVTPVHPVTSPSAEPHSSTLVREYLETGRPTRAALVLGRYWEVEARALPGGASLEPWGVPILRLPLRRLLLPKPGVYAVQAMLDRAGQAPTGWRPGWARLLPDSRSGSPELALHFLDPPGPVGRRPIRVAFVDYLREIEAEAAMSPDEFSRQLARDDREAALTLGWETWESEWPSGQAGDPAGG